MVSPQLLEYQDVLDRIADGPRHLLLGNGFSVAFDCTRYGYARLYSTVQERIRLRDPELAGWMSHRSPKSIEWMMSWLRATAVKELRLSEARVAEAEAMLRTTFCDAVLYHHKPTSKLIGRPKLDACASFLQHYDRVFTTNYDLLLSWVCLERSEPFDDGFHPPSGSARPREFGAECLANTRYLYLHGCLYLFQCGHLVYRLQRNTHSRLIDAIRNEVSSNGRYPLYVAEGDYRRKRSQISKTPYLRECFGEFGCIPDSLVVFGHSLFTCDKHIRDAIAGNQRISHLYVGIFTEADSKSKERTIKLANRTSDEHFRQTGQPLEVVFYRSESADPWGKRNGN